MMKAYLYIIFAIFPYLVQAEEIQLPEKDSIEREQVQIWESKLAAARTLEPREKILALGLGLRSMGWRRSFPDHGIEVDLMYRKLQQELLSTPGHARYFADEVERLIADPKNAGSSVRERSWYLRQTLVHLPSPETIQVLGSYLYDERFSLDPTVVNSGATGPTYALVAVALRHIGLRETEDYIRTQGTRWTTEEDIESIRRWWEEVKTGERTFSFKGQDVEYRFLPDGTWETIPIANPPDDGPGASEAKPAPANARESPAQLAVPADNESGVPWRWIWLGMAGLLFAGYLGLRKLRKRGR